MLSQRVCRLLRPTTYAYASRSVRQFSGVMQRRFVPMRRAHVLPGRQSVLSRRTFFSGAGMPSGSQFKHMLNSWIRTMKYRLVNDPLGLAWDFTKACLAGYVFYACLHFFFWLWPLWLVLGLAAFFSPQARQLRQVRRAFQQMQRYASPVQQEFTRRTGHSVDMAGMSDLFSRMMSQSMRRGGRFFGRVDIASLQKKAEHSSEIAAVLGGRIRVVGSSVSTRASVVNNKRQEQKFVMLQLVSSRGSSAQLQIELDDMEQVRRAMLATDLAGTIDVTREFVGSSRGKNKKGRNTVTMPDGRVVEVTDV
ncbi:MAG: hypothetical protein MHM6MM_002709 [Cercozoa sp. M6MM]